MEDAGDARGEHYPIDMSDSSGLTAAEAATSRPHEDGQDSVFQTAAARIAQEAQQQPFSYGKRKTRDVTAEFTAASKGRLLAFAVC